jgi:hypothetical protein
LIVERIALFIYDKLIALFVVERFDRSFFAEHVAPSIGVNVGCGLGSWDLNCVKCWCRRVLGSLSD